MFAADPKTDVEGAYAAWDAAFNRGDLKSIAAAYLPNAKLLPPTHEVASGQEAIEKFYAGALANGIKVISLRLWMQAAMTRSFTARRDGARKVRAKTAKLQPFLALRPTYSSAKSTTRSSFCCRPGIRHLLVSRSCL